MMIDIQGNFQLILPPTATSGFTIQNPSGNFEMFTPNGSFTNMSKELNLQSAGAASISSQGMLGLGSFTDTQIVGTNSVQVYSPNAVVMYSGETSIGGKLSATVSSPLSTLDGDTLAKVNSLVKSIVVAPDVRIGSEGASLRVILEDFLTIFNTHSHSGVTSGSHVSGPPLNQAPLGYPVTSEITKVS